MLSEYTNPLLSSNCPDPAVTRLMDGSGYALVASSDRASRSDNSSVFPMFFSKGCQSLIRFPLTSPLLFPDLVTWKLVRHVFSPTQLPVWAANRFYAPELHLVGGRYLLYFTAGDNQGKLRCGVALATSEDPFGDYSVLWDHYHCSARGKCRVIAGYRRAPRNSRGRSCRVSGPPPVRGPRQSEVLLAVETGCSA